MKKSEKNGYIQIIIASILFAFIPILVRLDKSFGVYFLTFLRTLFAAILLGVYFFIFRKKLVPLKYEKGKLVFFGAIHGFIILGYFIAIQYLSISSAVLLLYSAPIWMIIFSHFILKEKIRDRTIFALIISIIGVIFVLNPQNIFVSGNLIGSLAALISGVGFGLVYVLSKTFKKYDKVSLTFWQNLIAIPFLIPVLFFKIPQYNLNSLIISISLGLLTVFAFILVFKGLSKVSAQSAGVVVLLEIIFPIILAFIFFKEIPSNYSIVGGVLILIGSYIVMSAKS